MVLRYRASRSRVVDPMLLLPDSVYDFIEERSFENLVYFNLDKLLRVEKDIFLYRVLFSNSEKRRLNARKVILHSRSSTRICLSDKALRLLNEYDETEKE